MTVLLCDNVLWAVGAALSADEGSALAEPMPLLPQNDLRKLRSNFDHFSFFAEQKYFIGAMISHFDFDKSTRWCFIDRRISQTYIHTR
jgi:hypothetical protein